MIHDGGKNMDWKIYNKNFNQQITMNFWMNWFEPHFQKSLSWSFFIKLIHIAGKVMDDGVAPKKQQNFNQNTHEFSHVVWCLWSPWIFHDAINKHPT
jgi:hypothetical protein